MKGFKSKCYQDPSIIRRETLQIYRIWLELEARMASFLGFLYYVVDEVLILA